MSKLEVLLGRLEKVKGRNGSFVACCKKNNTMPRQVYQQYLNELKELLKVGVPKSNL